MYHCHIQFYFVGSPHMAFDQIKGMPPLDHFSHSFSESIQPEETLAAQADVILMHLTGQDPEHDVRTLISVMPDKAELILLADKEQIAPLSGCLEAVADIWTLPLSEDELRFRLNRWQQACRRDKDAWQTSQ